MTLRFRLTRPRCTLLTLILGGGATCCAQMTLAARTAEPQQATLELPDAPSYILQQQQKPAPAPPPPSSSKPDDDRDDDDPTEPPHHTSDSVTVSVPAPAHAHTVQQRIKCHPSDPACPATTTQFILNSRQPDPILSPRQKFILAGRDFIDPFNITVIGISSLITTTYNAHSYYGPGFPGFARSFGVGLTGSLTGEFFGVALIPSIAHQDPRYHRMPEGTMKQRIWHAVSRTVVSQSDHGKPMLNYSTLLTYPIANQLANAYVPGIQRDAASTGKRIALGYALDPVGNLINEFIPDIASRIHIRSVFFQQILNKIATDPSMGGTGSSVGP